MASLESSIPPSTHCSAATSCGGVRSKSSFLGAISATLTRSPSRSSSPTADKRHSNLWIINADGGDHRPLTTGNFDDTTPRWSPDGSQLLYISNRDGSPHDFDVFKFVVSVNLIGTFNVIRLAASAMSKTEPSPRVRLARNASFTNVPSFRNT